MNRGILAGLAAVFVGLALPGIAQAEWDQPVRLTNSEENSNLPTIGDGFAVSTPYVHVIYADKDNADEAKLFYRRSTDNGETWEEIYEVEQRSQAYTFSIAADNSGNVHVVNSRYPDRSLWYRRSTDNGASWETARSLSASSENPVLRTNGDRNVYILDPGMTDGSLNMLKSTDGGANWTGPASVATADMFGGFCADAGMNNHIYLAWSTGGMGNSKVYGKRSTDNGASWGATVEAVPTSGSGSHGIWSDDQGYVYLGFTIFASTRNFRRSTDGGQTWSSSYTTKAIIRDIACHGDRTVNAIAVVDDDKVYYLGSDTRGTSWVTDTIRISAFEPGARSKPYIEVGSDDYIHCAWNSRVTGEQQVMYRRHPGPVIGIAERPGTEPTAAWRLSPNPVRSTVTLHGNTAVTLFDESGARVTELQPGINDVGRLPRGVYFARLEANSASPGKLVKLQ